MSITSNNSGHQGAGSNAVSATSDVTDNCASVQGALEDQINHHRAIAFEAIRQESMSLDDLISRRISAFNDQASGGTQARLSSQTVPPAPEDIPAFDGSATDVSNFVDHIEAHIELHRSNTLYVEAFLLRLQEHFRGRAAAWYNRLDAGDKEQLRQSWPLYKSRPLSTFA